MNSAGAINKILRHYNNLHKNGKPTEKSQYTVLACCYVDFTANASNRIKNIENCSDERDDIQQSNIESDIFIISLATGTKCLGDSKIDNINGFTINDSHAEVLAKRGLQRYFWKCLFLYMTESEDNRLELIKHRYFPFNITNASKKSSLNDDINTSSCKMEVFLKDSWKGIHDTVSNTSNEGSIGSTSDKVCGGLCMYISDPPCGDSAIYCQEHYLSNIPNAQGQGTYTGAKLVSNSTAEMLAPASANDQILGMVRTKSGRSDIPVHLRTSSLSCSDKLCRWYLVGLQGSLLARYIQHPVRYSLLSIDRDPSTSIDAQYKALYRAITKRITDYYSFLATSAAPGAVEHPLPKLCVLNSVIRTTLVPCSEYDCLRFAYGKCACEYEANSLRDVAGVAQSTINDNSASDGAAPTPANKKRRVNTNEKCKGVPLCMNWVSNTPYITSSTSHGLGSNIGSLIATVDRFEEWTAANKKNTEWSSFSVGSDENGAGARASRLTYDQRGTTEVLLGVTGLLQGSSTGGKGGKKLHAKSSENCPGTGTGTGTGSGSEGALGASAGVQVQHSSRLCRFHMYQIYKAFETLLSEGRGMSDMEATINRKAGSNSKAAATIMGQYKLWKQESKAYQARVTALSSSRANDDNCVVDGVDNPFKLFCKNK